MNKNKINNYNFNQINLIKRMIKNNNFYKAHKLMILVILLKNKIQEYLIIKYKHLVNLEKFKFSKK